MRKREKWDIWRMKRVHTEPEETREIYVWMYIGWWNGAVMGDPFCFWESSLSHCGANKEEKRDTTVAREEGLSQRAMQKLETKNQDLLVPCKGDPIEHPRISEGSMLWCGVVWFHTPPFYFKILLLQQVN